MNNNEHLITCVDVGLNYVEIEINLGEIEMKFIEVSRDKIQKALKAFGLKLEDEELADYEY